jgi:hypothetical protein
MKFIKNILRFIRNILIVILLAAVVFAGFIVAFGPAAVEAVRFAVAWAAAKLDELLVLLMDWLGSFGWGGLL